jgi:cysteine-rich repeat protein
MGGCGDDDPECGDGTVDAGEECDDGNTTSGDGCSATCTTESDCGNGTVDTGEDCDDGDTTADAVCSATCTAVVPTGAIRVNFSLDDPNDIYEAADGLCLKGSFDVDATTRVVSQDTGWAALWPRLFDDGPWNMGGHEPAGAAADDHTWGVMFFVVPDATDPTAFEHGLVKFAALPADGFTCGVDGAADSGEAWIWTQVQSTNNTFTVAAGATADIDLGPFSLATLGTVDVRFMIDTTSLDGSFVLPTEWDASDGMILKSSAWGWGEWDAWDDGTNGDTTADDGIFTVTMSDADEWHPTDGLPNAGEYVQFIWVFDDGTTVTEYKVGGDGALSGTSAAYSADGTTFDAATVVNDDSTNCSGLGGNNTCFQIPAS